MPVVEADAAAERIGQRALLGDLDRMAGGKARDHRRAALHGDADDPASGFSVLTASATPEISPPPESGTSSVVEVRRVLDDLEAERALAGDDRLMVEGRDLGHAFLARPAGRPRRWASSWLVADDAHLGAQRLDRRATLLSGTSADMQMIARDAGRLAGMGDGAAVIAGRGGDDAGAGAPRRTATAPRWWRRAA